MASFELERTGIL